MDVDWLGKKGKKSGCKPNGTGKGKWKPGPVVFDKTGKAMTFKEGFPCFFKKGEGKGKGKAKKGEGIHDLGGDEHSQIEAESEEAVDQECSAEV